jgi:hypothetical protein
VRYGHSDLVSGVGWDDAADPMPDDRAMDQEAAQRAAQLTADLERTGATCIKFGQLLSTRVDLLPPVYTKALTRPQDDLEPFSFARGGADRSRRAGCVAEPRVDLRADTAGGCGSVSAPSSASASNAEKAMDEESRRTSRGPSRLTSQCSSSKPKPGWLSLDFKPRR